MPSRIGVDIGGVIIDRANDGTDTSFFTDNYLNTTATPDICDTLRTINMSAAFWNGIWVVSKCGTTIQAKTMDWLRHHQFYDRTGIARDRFHFTRSRIGKAAIARSLGLTHFVDDRLEVLGYMVEDIPNLYLFNPDPREVAAHEEVLSKVTVVNSAGELLADLLRA